MSLTNRRQLPRRKWRQWYSLPILLTWICLIGWHSVKRLRNSCRTLPVANPATEVTSMIHASNTCKNDTRHNIPRDTELRLRHIHALWDFTTRLYYYTYYFLTFCKFQLYNSAIIYILQYKHVVACGAGIWNLKYSCTIVFCYIVFLSLFLMTADNFSRNM